jgi:hypothetical protein
MNPCPLCKHPLRPFKNEYGDIVLRRGLLVTRCRNGHHFTAIPRDLTAWGKRASALRVAA